MLLQRDKIEAINDNLMENYQGWELGSNGKSKYFLSVFNKNNIKEELIFELDFKVEYLILEGLRFKEEGDPTFIPLHHKYFKEAEEIGAYIREKFL